MDLVRAASPEAPAAGGDSMPQLTNDTSLKWEPNREPDLAGYKIVWRDTTAAFWQHEAYAGNVTRYTVKGVSKDNCIFGVVAVDKDGNESVAVYPRPARGQTGPGEC